MPRSLLPACLPCASRPVCLPAVGRPFFLWLLHGKKFSAGWPVLGGPSRRVDGIWKALVRVIQSGAKGSGTAEPSFTGQREATKLAESAEHRTHTQQTKIGSIQRNSTHAFRPRLITILWPTWYRPFIPTFSPRIIHHSSRQTVLPQSSLATGSTTSSTLNPSSRPTFLSS